MIHTSKFILGYYRNYFDDKLPISKDWEIEFGGRGNYPICDESKAVSGLDMNHGSDKGPERLVTCPKCIKIMKEFGI